MNPSPASTLGEGLGAACWKEEPLLASLSALLSANSWSSINYLCCVYFHAVLVRVAAGLNASGNGYAHPLAEILLRELSRNARMLHTG